VENFSQNNKKVDGITIIFIASFMQTNAKGTQMP
jgi:hypothetical protein